MTPFIAVGEDELGEPTEIIRCAMCSADHPVEYGTSRTLMPDGAWSDPKLSRLLGFFRCGTETYLATISGRGLK